MKHLVIPFLLSCSGAYAQYPVAAGKERVQDTIYERSPAKVYLDVHKTDDGVIARLWFHNSGDEAATLYTSLLGGESLTRDIFRITSWQTPDQKDLTFMPAGVAQDELIVMQPGETIETETNLSRHYNFREKRYEIVSIWYLSAMNRLDTARKQMTRKDENGRTKPVLHSMYNNRLDLEYKDIR